MHDSPAPSTQPPQPPQREKLSVCLFCGSSNAADPDFLAAAEAFGAQLAAAGVRLVYGGGGIGLMGAAARGAHHAGGEVLGIIPDFLRVGEVVYDEVETVVVETMHQRKLMMFEQSDAFAVFPGGVGTLEEVIELISWRRLALHAKPIVFVDLKGFWQPFFGLIDGMIEQKFAPKWLPPTWGIVTSADQVLPKIREMIAAPPQTPALFRADRVSERS
jgi:uncharacterized protein (TIGR00730 family)